MSKPKNSKDALEFIHTLDSLAIKKQKDEIERLKAEVERLTALVESNLNSSKVAMGKADAVLHERDSLKAEVERLKEGNDCLGQMHDKEMERSAYLLEEFNRSTAWGRGLESDLSHARVEISFLKAEVERLEKDVWRMKVFKGIDEDSIQTLRAAVKTVPEWAKVLEAIENNARLEAENARLKAEVERLRASSFVTAVPVEQYERVVKAGDALAETLESVGFDSANDFLNAAKEGKPSV